MFDAKRLLDQFLGAGGVTGIDGSRQGSGLRRPARRGRRHARRPAEPGAREPDDVGRARRRARQPRARLEAPAASSPATRVKLGGLALVGGLAYKAYRDYQARQAGTSVPQQAPQPQIAAAAERHAVHAEGQRGRSARAAAGDGDDLRRQGGRHIDAAEQKRIFDRLDTVSLDTGIEGLCDGPAARAARPRRHRRRRRQPEVATEVYAASLLCHRSRTIRPRRPICRCSRRGSALPDELVQEIHKTAEAARVRELHGAPHVVLASSVSSRLGRRSVPGLGSSLTPRMARRLGIPDCASLHPGYG